MENMLDEVPWHTRRHNLIIAIETGSWPILIAINLIFIVLWNDAATFFSENVDFSFEWVHSESEIPSRHDSLGELYLEIYTIPVQFWKNSAISFSDDTFVRLL